MPIGFLNYWTKREISKRKQDEEGLLDAQADDSNNTNYIATSPTGATSGGQRNQRALEKAGNKENVRRSLIK